MGKLISIEVFEARRRGDHITEEQAAVLRGFREWMASRYAPETLAKRQKPPAQRGSPVQMKVVWRRQP
jgi:hypothetical protein